jgi:hypothetical protein
MFVASNFGKLQVLSQGVGRTIVPLKFAGKNLFMPSPGFCSFAGSPWFSWPASAALPFMLPSSHGLGHHMAFFPPASVPSAYQNTSHISGQAYYTPLLFHFTDVSRSWVLSCAHASRIIILHGELIPGS